MLDPLRSWVGSEVLNQMNICSNNRLLVDLKPCSYTSTLASDCSRGGAL